MQEDYQVTPIPSLVNRKRIRAEVAGTIWAKQVSMKLWRGVVRPRRVAVVQVRDMDRDLEGVPGKVTSLLNKVSKRPSHPVGEVISIPMEVAIESPKMMMRMECHRFIVTILQQKWMYQNPLWVRKKSSWHTTNTSRLKKHLHQLQHLHQPPLLHLCGRTRHHNHISKNKSEMRTGGSKTKHLYGSNNKPLVYRLKPWATTSDGNNWNFRLFLVQTFNGSVIF